MKNIVQYTIGLLEKMSIKHEVHHFPSGAIMIDIWHSDKFYVIQFDEDYIGFSEINSDNLSFDAIPDEKFINEALFKHTLQGLLINNNY